MVYLVLLVCLLLMRGGGDRADAKWLRIASAAGLTTLLAGGWFAWLQLFKLERAVCLWCMSEHAIGLVLALLIGFHAARLGMLRSRDLPAIAVVAVLAVAALIVGQHLDRHTYIAANVRLVGTSDQKGGYDEFDPGGEAARRPHVWLMEGHIRLDPVKHPMLGRPDAPYIVVEAMDYTCPRCRRLAGLIRQARPLLGVDYAFLILTTPLNRRCNKHYAEEYDEDDPRHAQACELARLAHAVWLTNAARFEAFHGWLFEHQEALLKDAAPARHKAEQLVGGEAIRRAMEQGLGAELVLRDVEVGHLLGSGALPRLYANDYVFSYLPEEPDTLAMEIVRLFHQSPPDDR